MNKFLAKLSVGYGAQGGRAAVLILLLLALLLTTGISVWGQSKAVVGTGTWTAGGDWHILYTSAVPEAHLPPLSPSVSPLVAQPLQAAPLRNATPLAEGLGSGLYMNSVGGVAFDKAAQPVAGLRVEHVALPYHCRQAEDGRRLSVQINDHRVTVAGLPDWQLVPLAWYVDSPYTALVTLKGKLKAGQQIPLNIQNRAHYVISLHPALESTLLGVRMFNADFMLLDGEVTGELPKRNGAYLLGSGEQAPVRSNWLRLSIELNHLLHTAGEGDRFQSYVICDHGVQPTFAVTSEELVLTGDPYFYFWKSGDGDLVEPLQEDGHIVNVHTKTIVPLPKLSAAISAQHQLLRNVNPAVYPCLVNTLRYAAFFRYCKRKDLDRWNAFLAQLREADPKDYESPLPVIVWNSNPNPQSRVIVLPE